MQPYRDNRAHSSLRLGIMQQSRILLGLLSCQMCHDSSAVGGCGVLYDEVDGYVCGLAGCRSLLLPVRSQTGCG